MGLKVFKMEAEDGEGPIHHDVSHHRIDVQSLEEKMNKQRAVFCFFFFIAALASQRPLEFFWHTESKICASSAS